MVTEWGYKDKIWYNPRTGKPLAMQPRGINKYEGLHKTAVNVGKAYAKKNKVTYCEI